MKSKVGRIVEHYCLDRGILLTPYGNWLVQAAPKEAGAEPDECYIFGATPEAKDRPDLVIEVVWTSGGLDKVRDLPPARGRRGLVLEARRHLGPRAGRRPYQSRAHSVCLPEFDLDLVCRLVSVGPLNEAIRQLREALGSTR